MLCDSNIIIYAADPADTRCLAIVGAGSAAIAAVTRIEVLGFPGLLTLDTDRRQRLEEIVAALPALALSEPIIQRSISLRQERKMSLADAIIGATALVHRLPLVTRNAGDFRHIEGLQVINPFEGA